MNKLIINIVGALIGLSAFLLTWVLYDWKLALLIFLMIMGNNLERVKS